MERISQNMYTDKKDKRYERSRLPRKLHPSDWLKRVTRCNDI